MNGNGPPAPAVPSPAELRAAIPWVEGHADVWRLFADPTLLTRCVHALALPFKGDGITHVVGIESRGFLLGGAAAVALGAGFVAVRKQPRSHFPGRVLSEVTGPDYKGEVCQLRLQADVLPRGARVLVVDDWFETGSQLRAARILLERAGAGLIGASVIVDQTDADLRQLLGKYRFLISAEALRPG